MSTPQYSPLIQSLGSIGLRVADLDAAVQHATEVLGLREAQRTASASYLTCDRTHHSVEYIAAEAPALDHVGLKAFDDRCVAEVALALEQQGIAYTATSHPGIPEAIRFEGPAGHAFEVYAHIDANEPDWYPTQGLRPLRFGHVTISADDVRPTEAFLTSTLRLLVSDRTADGSGSWLRCAAAHHVLAVIKAPVGIHHYAFDVSHIAEIARLGDLLAGHGKHFSFGPGRHALGRNIYCYYADPDGVTIEVTTDMEQVEDPNKPAGDWDPADPTVENLWGPLWTDPTFERITPLA